MKSNHKYVIVIVDLDPTEMGGKKKGAATKIRLGDVAPRRSKQTFSDQNFYQNVKEVDDDDNDNDDDDGDECDFCTRRGGVGDGWGQINLKMIKIDGTCMLSLILSCICLNTLEFGF